MCRLPFEVVVACVLFLDLLCLQVVALAKPNPVKHALITPAPDADLVELRKRSSYNTCAYVSGDLNSPLICGGASSCSYNPNGFWGCCDEVACEIPDHCASAGVAYCGGVGTVNCIYSNILQCTQSASPNCITYTRITEVGATVGYTSFGCGPNPTKVLAFNTAVGGAAASSTTAQSTTPAPPAAQTSITPVVQPTSQSAAQPSSQSVAQSNSLATSQTGISTSASGEIFASNDGGASTSSISTASPSSAAAAPTNSNNGPTTLSKAAEIGTIIGCVVAVIGLAIVIGRIILNRRKRLAERQKAAAGVRLVELNHIQTTSGRRSRR